MREQIRESLGVNEPLVGQYLRWARMMFITEPLIMLEDALCSQDRLPGRVLPDGCWQIVPRTRRASSATRRAAPVFDLIAVSLPQTLWVVGTSYIIGILIGVPLGIISAYKQYSVTDQAATFFSMVGFLDPDLLHRNHGDHHLLGLDAHGRRGGGCHRVTPRRMSSMTGTASSFSFGR